MKPQRQGSARGMLRWVVSVALMCVAGGSAHAARFIKWTEPRETVRMQGVDVPLDAARSMWLISLRDPDKQASGRASFQLLRSTVAGQLAYHETLGDAYLAKEAGEALRSRGGYGDFAVSLLDGPAPMCYYKLLWSLSIRGGISKEDLELLSMTELIRRVCEASGTQADASKHEDYSASLKIFRLVGGGYLLPTKDELRELANAASDRQLTLDARMGLLNALNFVAYEGLPEIL